MRLGFVPFSLLFFDSPFIGNVVFSFRVCVFVWLCVSIEFSVYCNLVSHFFFPSSTFSVILYNSIKISFNSLRPFPKDRGTLNKANGVWKPYKWPQWLGRICNFQTSFWFICILLYDQFHTHTHIHKNTQITSIHAFRHDTVRRWNIFTVHYMQKCLKNRITAARKRIGRKKWRSEHNTVQN